VIGEASEVSEVGFVELRYTGGAKQFDRGFCPRRTFYGCCIRQEHNVVGGPSVEGRHSQVFLIAVLPCPKVITGNRDTMEPQARP